MHSAVLSVYSDGIGGDNAGAVGNGGDGRGRGETSALGDASLPAHDVGQGNQDVGVGGRWDGGVAGLQNEHYVEAVDDNVSTVDLLRTVGTAGPEVADKLLGLGKVELATDLGVHGDRADTTVKLAVENAENVLGVNVKTPSDVSEGKVLGGLDGRRKGRGRPGSKEGVVDQTHL